MADKKDARSDDIFIRRSLVLLGILGAAVLLVALRDLLILIFGSIVIAVLLTAVAAPIQRYTRAPRGLSLALAILALIALVGGAGALFGAQVARQAQQLSGQLPQAWNSARDRLAELGVELPALGREEAEEEQQAEDITEDPAADSNSSGVSFGELDSDFLGRASGILMAAFGGVAHTLLVLAGGVYLAAQPSLYRTGLLKLFPQRKRALVADAYDHSGRALSLWLMGTFVSMGLVGILTGLGLWLLGVPSAAALGLLAGLFEFVPIIGPIAASIPAILIALSQSTELALWTLGLFIVVQQIEGNLIQPLVQRYVVDLPPALLLFSVVAGGYLFGVVGVIFAAPLTVVVFVLVKRLYVQEALGTDTPLPDDD
jgi:predicted PurR-regulated permease PerM